MREMILNHASLADTGQYKALAWLADMASGMAGLVRDGVARKSLRTCRSVHEIRLLDELSLFDAYRELQRRGNREESAFLMSLTEKTPLLSGVEPEVADRFLACEATACEAKTLPSPDGDPLVLCAVTNGVAVGFPSDPVWDRDRVSVIFAEMLRNGEIESAAEDIDNLARSAHAAPIADRHRERLRLECRSPTDLWRRRGQLFPHLTFGPDVENHLAENAGRLTTVVNRLADLDTSAAAWRESGGAAPPWTCKVTPESESVMNDERLRERRRFRSVSGARDLFEWHARFGSSGRIHLRFEARERTVEIGYVGPHLPL